jgi:hypothetical protein
MVGFAISSKFIELLDYAISVLVQSLNASEIFVTSFRNKPIGPLVLRSSLTTDCCVAVR